MSREWVLLRGLAREKHHTDHFIQKLQAASPDSEVIAIDLPGAGDYYRLSSPVSMEGIAEFVHSQLPPKKKDKRYVVAISLGGMVAIELARLHPQTIDGLVIINSSFKNVSSLFERLQPEALWYIFKAIFAKTSKGREREVLNMVSNHPQRNEWVEPWALIAQQRPVSPFNFLKQLIAAATYDLPLQKPQVPIYVLTSEGDRMVNPKCSKTIAEQWQLPLAVHPTAGHEIYIDDPDWVIQQLFLYCGK